VPFACPGARFTRDFEDLTALLATKTGRTTIARVLRIGWDTMGWICERVAVDGRNSGCFDGLVHVGVAEVSWTEHHDCLTLLTDHDTRKVVWGKACRSTD
jgi:hypothetical protein